MPIPSDGTTSSHNIKEDGNAIRTNGERPRWITPYQKIINYTRSYTRLALMNSTHTLNYHLAFLFIITKWQGIWTPVTVSPTIHPMTIPPATPPTSHISFCLNEARLITNYLRHTYNKPGKSTQPSHENNRA
jgi:hypothetical protein